MTNNSLTGLLTRFKSYIFWQIATGVFVSILLVEAGLLAYSWYTERNRLIARMDESLVTFVALLDAQDPLPQLNNLVENKQHSSNYHVVSYLYKKANGHTIVGDTSEELDALANDDSPTRISFKEQNYIRYFARQNENGTSDQIWLHADLTGLHKYMRNFILRITGMVLLLSFLVTAACLIYLNPVLIQPLRRLNNLLIGGEKHGIDRIKAEPRDLARSDEIGSVNRSFENLRHDLIGAELEKNTALQRSEDFANIGADCFWEVDRQFKFTHFAGDANKFFGLRSSQITDATVRTLGSKIDGLKTEGLEHGNNDLIKSLVRDGQWKGTLLSASKKQKPLNIHISAVAIQDSSGTISGYRGTLKDISVETELANKLMYQATHDELTGLYNRHKLTEMIAHSLSRFEQQGESFSFMVIDLDRFKHVNDTAGHIAGDALLKIITDKIATCIGDNGHLGRVGGDEFAAILNLKDNEMVKRVAEHIRETIEQITFSWNNNTYKVTASIGVAEMAPELSTHQALIFAADTCCMKAKKNGKNQIQFYAIGDTSISFFKDEALWLNRITNALENNEFTLFRQSIVPVDQSIKEEHFEVLIRMQDPEGGFYPPNLFLPAAERNNLMPQIDKWVIENALNWLERQTITEDVDFCMNLNLSAASLEDKGFKSFLIDRISNNSELNKYVCLEITESVAMINFEDTVELLHELKSAGCKSALDDFGTGFSSLSHIRNLPLDYIKIDGTFIKDIVTSELDQVVVKSVAEIARVLGIKTVGEFVDNEAALGKLDEFNIDYAQGYMFSKPEPLEKSASDTVKHKAA